MSNLPRFELFPDNISKEYPNVLILLSESLQEEDITITIQVPGKSSEKVEATIKDDRTYIVRIPDAYFFHDRMMIYVQYKSEFLGAGNLAVEKVQERLARILERVVDPIELIMSSLGLSRGEEANLNALDCDLANVVHKNIPPRNLKLLFEKYNNPDGEEDGTYSDCRFPTALHFAAHYGFLQLTTKLLECVGSSSAQRIRNCDGQTPSEVAESRGHNSVYDRLTQTKSADEDEYASVEDLGLSQPEETEESTYLLMSVGKNTTQGSRMNPSASPTGPRLPETLPPPRPRTGSISQLQVIAELDTATEQRDSGIYESDPRNSKTSFDSIDSGTFRQNSLEDAQAKKKKDISRAKVITKNTPPKNRPPSGDPDNPAIPYQRAKRPSLPNIWSPGELPPPLPQKHSSPPPPACTGVAYVNFPAPATAPRPRKMSLPGTLDIRELKSNQMFQKQSSLR